MEKDQIEKLCEKELDTIKDMYIYENINKADIETITSRSIFTYLRELQFMKTVFSTYLFLSSECAELFSNEVKFLIPIMKKNTFPILKASKLKGLYDRYPALRNYLSSCFVNSMFSHGPTSKICENEYMFIKNILSADGYDQDFKFNIVSNFVLDDHLFIEEFRNRVIWDVINHYNNPNDFSIFLLNKFIESLTKLDKNRQKSLHNVFDQYKYEGLTKLLFNNIITPLMQIWNFSPGLSGTKFIENWNPPDDYNLFTSIIDLLVKHLEAENALPSLDFINTQKGFTFLSQLDIDIINDEINESKILENATIILYTQTANFGANVISEVSNYVENNDTLRVGYISLKERARDLNVSVLKLIPGIIEQQSYFQVSENANEVTLSYLRQARSDISSAFESVTNAIGHMSETEIKPGIFESAEILKSQILAAGKSVDAILYYFYSNIEFTGFGFDNVQSYIDAVLKDILERSAQSLIILMKNHKTQQEIMTKQKLFEGFQNHNIIDQIANIEKGFHDSIVLDYENGCEIVQIFADRIRKALELSAIDKIGIPIKILYDFDLPTESLMEENRKIGKITTKLKSAGEVLNLDESFGKSLLTISDLLLKTDILFQRFSQGALQGAVAIACPDGKNILEAKERLKLIVCIAISFKSIGFHLDGIMDFENSELGLKNYD